FGWVTCCAWRCRMPLPPYDAIELPLLREILTAGGEAEPAYIYPRLRQYFPGIADGDLQATLPGSSANRWTNRSRRARQYLVRKGELFREPRGLWRITPKGRARVESVPISPQGG